MFPDISRDDIFRLETRHLWLRWLRAADAPAVGAFATLAAVAQMTASIPHPYPPGEAERFILAARASTAAGQALVLGITLKNKARTLIGIAGGAFAPAESVEIGYCIAPAQAGRGFATEAAHAIVEAVFSLTEAGAVVASSRTINPASRRVLEKCGFSHVDTRMTDLPARGGLHPCDHFSLSRTEWLARDGLHVAALAPRTATPSA